MSACLHPAFKSHSKFKIRNRIASWRFRYVPFPAHAYNESVIARFYISFFFLKVYVSCVLIDGTEIGRRRHHYAVPPHRVPVDKWDTCIPNAPRPFSFCDVRNRFFDTNLFIFDFVCVTGEILIVILFWFWIFSYYWLKMMFTIPSM